MTAHIFNEQDFENVDAILSAMNDGNYVKASELFREFQIPVAPHIAMAIKKVGYGHCLIGKGYNLSDVEKEYGKDWLTK